MMFAFLHRFLGSRRAQRHPLSEKGVRIDADRPSGASPVEPAAAGTIQAEHGPFERLFRQGPDYLTLLGLGPEAVPALRSVADVVRENPQYRQGVLALLDDPGWRPHLVAAVAVLFSRDRADLSPALWEAFDRGSWVAPQLGVVLSICDPQFVPHAKQRIVMGCPVAPADIQSGLERHVVAGPGGRLPRSAKNLATLLHLVHAVPGESEWAEAARQASDFQQLLRTDSDQSDKLAAFWAAALRDRLADLGVQVPLSSRDDR